MQDEILSITTEGRIDSKNAAAVEEEIESALAETGARRVRLDATDLEYISSAGLRVLVTTQKIVTQRGGTMVLHNPNDEVYDVLDMTGLIDVFTIER
jgi:anti-sigma B factor antagonist